jgi:alpha-tubulin suppressor-like RCC1 family protein/PKD repeat protein/D-arabinose 5-phosphate isomerase GutQ
MKSIPKILSWICLIIWLCHPPLYCADIEQVSGLHSITHVSHQVSKNTQITVVWEAPFTGLHNITGYYYLFNTNSTHVFTMDNTSYGEAIYVPKDAPRVAVSTNYSNLDDRAIYCHVAAVNEMDEIIGPTQTVGPYRVDDVPPFPATVIAPAITSDSVITLRMGAQHADEMNISSHAYARGIWEPFQQVRTWQLDDYVGNHILYVCFRDAAGNVSQTQATIWYDSVRAKVDLQAAVSQTIVDDPIPVTITFDEGILNFNQSDIVVKNGQLENFSFQLDNDGFASIFTTTVQPINQGEIHLSVPENAANDLAQNGNIASETLSILYDSLRPTVSLSSDVNHFTQSVEIPITVTFSEPVYDFHLQGDIFTQNAIPENLSGVGNAAPYSIYTFVLKASGEGLISAQIPADKAKDVVGNTNFASAMIAFTHDITKPKATIETSYTNTAMSPVSVTIVFSELCRLTSADAIQITNATMTNFVDSNDYYTKLNFQLTPQLSENIEISLKPDTFYDQAHNLNADPVFSTIPFDSLKPTVWIGSDISSPTYFTQIPVWIAFNKPVTNFESTDITVSNAHIDTFTKISSSQYEIKLVFDSPGKTQVLIPQGVALDVSGHTNFPSAVFEITYEPNTPQMLSAIEKAFCLEDQIAGPISVGISDAEGGTYTVLVQTSDLLSVASDFLTLCVDDNCQAMPFKGLILSAQEQKSIQLFAKPLPNVNGVASLTITVMDTVYTVSQSLTLGITPVNDPPVLEIKQNPIIYTEDDPPTIIAQSASVTDLDSSNFFGGRLIVDFVEPNADNLLEIRSQGTDPGLISVTLGEIFWGNHYFASYTGGNGTMPMTINFDNTLADINAIAALIKCITYENMSQRPTGGTIQARFQLDDGDGGISVPKTNAFTIISINDPPEVILSSKSVAYTENQEPVFVSEYVRIEDKDATTCQSYELRIEITENATPFDRLIIQDQGDAYGKIGVNGKDVKHSGKRVGQWSGGTGVDNPLIITFNDLAKISVVQGDIMLVSVYSVLQAVTYHTESDMPSILERTITITLTEPDGTTSGPLIRKISVTSDNDPPEHHISENNIPIDEDTSLIFSGSRNIYVTDPDALNNDLRMTITLDNGTFSLGNTNNVDFLTGDGFRDTVVVINGNLSEINRAIDGITFFPNPNFSGTTGMSFRTTDQGATGSNGLPRNDSDTITIIVREVPDFPQMSDPGIITFDEDTIASVSLHLTDVDGGIINLSVASAYTPLIPTSQISLTSTDLAKVDSGYTILTSKDKIYPLSLHIQPAADQFGETDIAIILTDTAGLTFTRNIHVNVLPVNDMPNISSIANQITIEDIPSAPIAFTVTDLESAPESFSFSVNASEPSKISDVTFDGQGNLRTMIVYTAHDAVGSVQITVTVWDHQGGKSQTSFGLTIIPVNDAPVIKLQSTASGLEDNTTIIPWSLIDMDGDLLRISAISTNEDRVPDENIIIDGPNVQKENDIFKLQSSSGEPSSLSLIINPLENQNGEVNVIMTITDAGGLPVIAKCLLHITPVNDPPIIAPIETQSTNEDTYTFPIPIQISDIDNNTNDLSISAHSLNLTLVSDEGFLIEGQGQNSRLIITPRDNQNGIAPIIVIVGDPDGLTSSTQFNLEILPVNDPPIITDIDDQITAINIPIDPIPFMINDYETSANALTLSAQPSIAIDMYFSGTDNNRWLHIINPQTYIGLVFIDIIVTDSERLSSSTSFTLTITEHNDPPEISDINDQVIQEDGVLQNLRFTISDIQTIDASELEVSIQSMNEYLVPQQNITLAGINAEKYLTIKPVRNRSGNAVIQIMVKDPYGLKTKLEFTLTVLPDNDPPILSLIPSGACGSRFTLLHDLAGRSVAFGLNNLGQLGIGKPDNQYSPVPMQNNFIRLYAGDLHASALTVDGSVYVWGSNDFSQLGIENISSANTPQLIPTIKNIQSMALGGQHSIALDYDGKLWGWGYNTFGQTGTESIEPVKTPIQLIHDSENQPLNPMIAISAGKFHSVALDRSGTVWAWGRNNWGQLGDGSINTRNFPGQVLDSDAGFFQGVVAISSGENYVLALTNDGLVWAWGENSSGQLGLPREEKSRKYPQLIEMKTPCRAIAAGHQHALALTIDGHVMAWGNNTYGQLGIGNYIATYTPTQVVLDNNHLPLDHVQAIDAGDDHSMAILDNGHVMLWGKNSSGQLGDNTPTDRPNPVPLEGNDPDDLYNAFTFLEDHNAISFAMMSADAETESQFLTATAQSYDLSMIRQENITIANIDGETVLEVTPVPDAQGMANICISLSDTDSMAVTSCLQLYIENINDPPRIAQVPPQKTSEDTMIDDPIILTISDLESPAKDLTVSGYSLNPEMISESDLTIVGAGNSRLLFIETKENTHGIVIIVLTVHDPQGLTQSVEFPLFINDRPDISGPSIIQMIEDKSFSLNFTVADIESAPCSITPVILSANPSLIDANAIAFTCNNNQFEAKIIPQTNKSGTCMLTLIVSDDMSESYKIITATIQPVNDPPEIHVAQSTKTYTENASPLLICKDAELVDVDSLSFDSGRLSVQLTENSEIQDRLFIKNSTVINEIQVIEVSGNLNVFYGGNPLGTISGGQTGYSPLVIRLSNNVSRQAMLKLIQQIAFTHDSDRPQATDRHITVVLTESDGTVGIPASLTIPVAAVNDDPQLYLGNTAISNAIEISSLYEKEQLIFDSTHVGQLMVTDPDILTDKMSLEIKTEKGIIILNADDAIQMTQVTNTHIAISGPLTAMNTALESMVYSAFADVQGKEIISIKIMDHGHNGLGGGLWQTFELHTIILSDNDPPRIQQIPDQYFDEDTVFSIPFAVTVVDGDDIVLTIASFASDIIQPDRISLTGSAIIESSNSQYTIRVGVDASAALTLVCRPETNQSGEVPFVLTALDPELYSHVYHFSVHVRQVNDPPHLSGMFTPMTYIENSLPISFCKGINLFDPDHADMVQAVVRIVDNYQYGDHLSQTLFGNIIAVADGNSLTFLGVSSWTDYESVLDSLTFEHSTDNPNVNTRSIVITVNDGVDNSLPITRTIHVNASNDRPGLWLNNEQVKDFQTVPDILEESQLRFNNEENYLEIRDPDVREGIMNIQISANKGLLTLNALATQNLTIVQGKFVNFDSVIFQGQLTHINSALNGMYYWASPDQLGDAHIVVRMNDNGFSGDGPGIEVIQMLSFKINAVNDPPIIAKINSRVTLEDTAVSIPVSLSDQESDPLTIWLESDNVLLVDPAQCAFIGDRILLVNKNKYVIDTSGIAAQITAVIKPSEDSYGQTMLTVFATDGQLTETRQFSFSVLSDNDPPKFTAIPSESFPEALTKYYLDLNPYVLDIDHPDDQLQWAASSDALDVSISNGILSMFPPNSDWYGTAYVYLIVTDPEGLSLTGTITIEITPVPDAPTISLIPDQVFALGANLPILPFTVTDAEGGELKISINSFNEKVVPNNDNALSINDNGRNYQFITEAGITNNLALSIIPVADIGGAADICMTVTDDSQLSTTSCFNVHMAPFLITAISGSHGKIDPEGVIAIDKEGAYLPLYFIPDPTYQVDMVIVDGKSVGSVSEYIFFDIRDNHSIRVSFRTADTFTITPKAFLGGTINPSEIQTVYAGDDATFKIIPNTGYAIADVRINNVSVGITKEYMFENISKNHEIAAYFKTVASPVAQFDANPQTGYAPLTVQMVNQSQGDIESYKWNFGDSSDSGLPAPVHTYASPGQYTVSLTVTGPGGSDTLVKNDYITVQRVPVQIDFQADQRLGVAPLMVQFIETSEDTIISRRWNFGDGQTSHFINPSHIYETPGNYSVSLTVTADAGTRVIEKKNYIQVLGRKIFGNVTGEDIGSQGLSGYNISVWQENIVIAETTTDNSGNYTVVNLPVHASLRVAACPPDGQSKYFCQYFNQQETLDQADSVSTVDTNAEHIDFVLEPAPDNGIRGEIIDLSGLNEIYIVEIWSESIGMGRSVNVDENNRFELNGLRPATDYRVYVWSSELQQFFYYTIPSGETPGLYLPTTSASAWQAATKVPVGMANLNDINIFIHSDPFIRGTVLVDGIPLASQWVNAWSSVLQAGFGAFTNALGEYEIVGLLADYDGAPVSYIVEVQDSPYPYQVYDNQTQRENATLVYVNTDHVDFNLQGGASISGTVTDFNGLPLNQVTVSAQSQSTNGRGTAVTDANGYYIIDGLPPASDYIVAVYPVYYPLTYYSNKSTKEEANLVNVSGAGAKNIDFILQKGAIIRGFLYLETMDQPAPSGIWVNVWSESTQTGGDVPTDATGRYEITGLDADATDYVISVITPDYVPSFYAENAPNQTVHKWELAQGVQPSRTIQRNMILIKGGQLSGRVSFNNESIDGVYIEAWSTDTQAWRSVLSSGNTSGSNYLIEGLLPGSYQIRFSHSLYIDVSKAITIFDGNNQLNMILEKPNRQISGTILGLEVGTECTLTAWSKEMNVAESKHIKGNGSPIDYRFDNLKPGNDYRVEFRSTHYPFIVYDNASHWTDAKKIDISNGNAGDIDFDLPPPGRSSISGTISLPEIPQPGTSIWIDAYSDQLQTGKGIELIVSNTQVAYQLHGLQSASDYIVSVWSAKYQDIFYNQTSKRSDATLVDTNDADQIDFILSSGGRISGFVKDTSNKPVYGMIIEIQSDQTGLYYGVVTNDRGYFQMDGLSRASDYIVAAHNPGESIQYYTSVGMTIDRKKATYLNIDNNSISLQLSLIQTGWIKGKVTDETGKAITGIWVSAWSDTAGTGSSAHTDNDGKFTIAGLPDALDFEVSVQSVDGAYIDQTRGPIAVYAENVLFVMTKGFSFKGRVEDMNSNGQKNVSVVLWSSMTNIFRSVQTSTTGQFEIQGLKSSDDYILRVTPQPDVSLAIFQEKGIQLNTSKTRTIVLTEGIRVAGKVQVLNLTSGAWINYTKSTNISVYTIDNSFLVSGQSKINGTYAISNIPRQSTIILRVNAPGFTPLEISLDTQAQTNTQDLKLVSGASINGCIKDQAGRLIKNARIMIRSTEAQMAVTGISDNQGCFEIAGLLDTVFDYEITVQADGYISLSKGGKQAGDTVHFTLFQTSPHAITGRILDRYRNVPPESVSVVVKLFEKTDEDFGGYIGKTQIDENGYFSFIGLKAEQAYHIQCIARLADGSEVTQWALDDNGVGRDGADDYLPGDDFEMIVDVVWE